MFVTITLRLQLIFITDADTKTMNEHLNRWPEEQRFTKGHLSRQKVINHELWLYRVAGMKWQWYNTMAQFDLNLFIHQIFSEHLWLLSGSYSKSGYFMLAS